MESNYSANFSSFDTGNSGSTAPSNNLHSDTSTSSESSMSIPADLFDEYLSKLSDAELATIVFSGGNFVTDGSVPNFSSSTEPGAMPYDQPQQSEQQPRSLQSGGAPTFTSPGDQSSLYQSQPLPPMGIGGGGYDAARFIDPNRLHAGGGIGQGEDFNGSQHHQQSTAAARRHLDTHQDFFQSCGAAQPEQSRPRPVESFQRPTGRRARLDQIRSDTPAIAGALIQAMTAGSEGEENDDPDADHEWDEEDRGELEEAEEDEDFDGPELPQQGWQGEDAGAEEEDLEAFDMSDPFAAAEQYIKDQLELLPLEYDDADLTMRLQNVKSLAYRLRDALLHPPETPLDLDEKDLDKFKKQQNEALKKLRHKLNSENGGNVALAYCLRLLDVVRRVHTEGVQKETLVKRKERRAAATKAQKKAKNVEGVEEEAGYVGGYVTEDQIICSERCEMLIRGVRTDKRIAFDVVFHSRNMIDFVCAPQEYMRRKLSNLKSNSKKKKKMEDGVKYQAQEEKKAAKAKRKQSEQEALMQQHMGQAQGQAGAALDGTLSSSFQSTLSKSTTGRSKPKSQTSRTSTTVNDTQPPLSMKRTYQESIDDEEEEAELGAAGPKRQKQLGQPQMHATANKPVRAKGTGQARQKRVSKYDTVSQHSGAPFSLQQKQAVASSHGNTYQPTPEPAITRQPQHFNVQYGPPALFQDEHSASSVLQPTPQTGTVFGGVPQKITQQVTQAPQYGMSHGSFSAASYPWSSSSALVSAPGYRFGYQQLLGDDDDGSNRRSGTSGAGDWYSGPHANI